jgi:hypothetical protein
MKTSEVTHAMLELARERAEKGYNWLLEAGQVHGLNINLVNLETLQLSSDSACILAQAGDSTYCEVINGLLKADVVGEDEPDTWSEERGFANSPGVTYRALTLVWQDLLTRERGED